MPVSTTIPAPRPAPSTDLPLLHLLVLPPTQGAVEWGRIAHLVMKTKDSNTSNKKHDNGGYNNKYWGYIYFYR